MSTRANWFDRPFDLRVPASEFPVLAERLRRTPEQLAARAQNLSRAILVHHESGEWPVQVHAGRLLDLEPLWASRLEGLVACDRQLVAADVRNRKTHEAGHNARRLSDLLEAFAAARREFVRGLETLGDAALLAETPPERPCARGQGGP